MNSLLCLKNSCFHLNVKIERKIRELREIIEGESVPSHIQP